MRSDMVGWMVAERESGVLAERLIREACEKQGVGSNQLVVHADRGSAMTSDPVLGLFQLLGITPSHNRPRVSNDNPYSESQFKTLKYRLEFPERFGGPQHARSFCGPFFRWYNEEHRHTGVALLTLAIVHYGRAPEVLAERQRIVDLAYARNPERFVRGRPRVAQLPAEVWINQPGREVLLKKLTH